LNPVPHADLVRMIQNWPAHVNAARQVQNEAELRFTAAVMQLWGIPVHQAAIIPIGLGLPAQCNWVYSRFVPLNAPEPCNIDDGDAAALTALFNGGNLVPHSFNAVFESIVGLLRGRNPPLIF
jgi:hypothetical protein